MDRRTPGCKKQAGVNTHWQTVSLWAARPHSSPGLLLRIHMSRWLKKRLKSERVLWCSLGDRTWIETGGRRAGHTLWRNDIAFWKRTWHKLIRIKWVQDADKSTSTRPWASVHTHCNTSARETAHSEAPWHFQGWLSKTKKWEVVQFLEISTPSLK